MKAALIYHNKVIAEDSITELVIWKLPEKTQERPHGIKCRLYYGDNNGNCIVRYDNESGKGDHKHIGNKVIAYHFVSVVRLIKDFIFDITAREEK